MFEIFSKLFSSKKEMSVSEDIVKQADKPYQGLKVMIRVKESGQIFFGRLQGLVDNTSLINMETVPSSQSDLPINLRGFDYENRIVIHMDGVLVQDEKGNWKIAEINNIRKEEDRSSFRQKVKVEGIINQEDKEIL